MGHLGDSAWYSSEAMATLQESKKRASNMFKSRGFFRGKINGVVSQTKIMVAKVAESHPANQENPEESVQSRA
eukprot:12408673-Karenia_brevis.AAC.1